MKKRMFRLSLLIALMLVAVLISNPVTSPVYGDGNDGLEKAIAAHERHTEHLMANPGVVGTAVGFNPAGVAAVKIFTKEPGVAGLPNELDDVPVVIEVTGTIVALSDPTARFPRPVPIGVSTGHPNITADTIGARVKDAAGNVYALSNNHVYANSNEANIGDSALQPGPFDGGQDPEDKIGELYDFEPIDFSGGNNTMDAAIASSTTALLGNSTPADDGYGTPSSTIVAASVGLNVKKYGRTTKLTQGEVSEINVTVDVCYECGGPPWMCICQKSARFVDQIAISPGDFSAGGDSGSLIVTDNANNHPVGLLFAGSSTRTIANRIDLVLDRFNVTIDDASSTSNDPPSVAITSPADGSSFESGATILFEGTASDTEDGDLTASLVWTSDIDGQIGTGGSFSTSLSDGNHTITAQVTDSGGATGSDAVGITVGTPTEPTTVTVDSITYATEGGRNNDKHLNVTVALVDDLGNPVSGASVSIELYRDGALDSSGTGTTGTDGTVTFSRKNAPSGCYTTTVTDVTATGLNWDGVTPANQFCK